MGKIKGDELFAESKKPFRVYRNDELDRFNSAIQKFYDPYVIQSGKDKGKEVRVLNFKKLTHAYGATDKSGAVFIERFEQFQNLWDQHSKYQDRKNWVDRKQNEEWEKTADEMAIEKTKSTVSFINNDQGEFDI